MAVNVDQARSKLKEAQAILDSVHLDFQPLDVRSAPMTAVMVSLQAAEGNVRMALTNLAKLDP